MSQYLSFFIRNKNSGFVPIGEYSRSTKVYDVVNAPYGKIRRFAKEEFDSVICRLKEEKEVVNSLVKFYNESVDFITKMNNSLVDKLDAVTEHLGYIEECNDSLADLDRWIVEINFIKEMLCRGCEIFVGVEIGSPTDEDILCDNL